MAAKLRINPLIHRRLIHRILQIPFKSQIRLLIAWETRNRVKIGPKSLRFLDGLKHLERIPKNPPLPKPVPQEKTPNPKESLEILKERPVDHRLWTPIPTVVLLTPICANLVKYNNKNP